MGELHDLLSRPVFQRVGWALVHFLWQGAVLGSLVAFGLLCLRQRSANLRYLVACAGLLVAAVCPVVTMMCVDPRPAPANVEELPLPIAGSDPFGEPFSLTTVGGRSSVVRSKETSVEPQPGLSPSAPVPTHSAAATPPPRKDWRLAIDRVLRTNLPWFVVVWFLGVLVLAVRLLAGWLEIRRIARTATLTGCEPWLPVVRRLSKQLGVSRPVRLVKTTAAAVPMVVGWLRPVILLPVAVLSGLAPTQLELILAHELAHVRRHDYVVNLLQVVMETLLFYHPAVHWLSRQIRIERENCCDDVAVAACGSAKGYARALAELADLASNGAEPNTGAAVAATDGSLLDRTRRLLGLRADDRKTRVWRGAGAVALLLVSVLVAGIVLTAEGEGVPGRVSGDPSTIILQGVRADGDAQLYDPGGMPIEARRDVWSGPVIFAPSSWDVDEQRRDFLFQVSTSDEPISFLPWARVYAAGTESRVGGGWRPQFGAGDGGAKMVLPCIIDRTFTKRIATIPLRGESVDVEVPVQRVDVTLRYYQGPPDPAAIRFAGPFRAGVVTRPVDGSAYEFTPQPQRPWMDKSVRFHLSTKLAFDSKTVVLVYDTSGQRHLLESAGGSFGDRGAECGFKTEELPLDSIAFVTIGEEPRERTFHDVVITYSDRPASEFAPHLEAMAERLGRTNLTAQQLAENEIRSAREALQVIDLVRGSEIWHSAQTILNPHGIDLDNLEPEVEERLRRTCRAWLQADDPVVRSCGVAIGLRRNWPEFVAPAVELLRHPSERARGKSAEELYRYRQPLAAEEICELADVLLANKDPQVHGPALRHLLSRKTPASTAACWELARTADHQAWLWLPAIRKLNSWGELKKAPLSEQLRIRRDLAFRVNSSESLGDEKTRALLLKLLTPDLQAIDQSVWSSILHVAVQEIDRKRVTAAMIDFLRGVTNYKRAWRAIDRIARQINLWHDVDIGHLGKDVSRETLDLNLPWPTIAADAVQWYETAPRPDEAGAHRTGGQRGRRGDTASPPRGSVKE